MKYIKTFESFDHNITNEGWLWGEGSIWSKIGNWISNWKNKKMAEGAEAFNAWAEKNPEKIEEMKAKLKPEFDKLSDKDKEELVSKLENYKGEEPPADVVEAAAEVAKVEEKLKRCKEGTKIYESNSLILEKVELSLGRKILKWLGLGMQYLGMFMIAMAFITYFATAMFAAAGIVAVAAAVGPWLILGAFVGGLVIALTGVYAQYKANPKDPNFAEGNYRTGWESSGRGIM
jgi:hypothetical protein